MVNERGYECMYNYFKLRLAYRVATDGRSVMLMGNGCLVSALNPAMRSKLRHFRYGMDMLPL